MKPRLDAAYREHNDRLQKKQEEEESKHRTYSSSKVQVEEERPHSSNKIQEEDTDKTLLEEKEEDWSVQKALSGVAGIGYRNEQQQRPK